MVRNTRIDVYAPIDLAAEVEELCDDRDKSVSEFFREAGREKLARHRSDSGKDEFDEETASRQSPSEETLESPEAQVAAVQKQVEQLENGDE